MLTLLPACPPAHLPACPPVRLPACPPARLHAVHQCGRTLQSDASLLESTGDDDAASIIFTGYKVTLMGERRRLGLVSLRLRTKDTLRVHSECVSSKQMSGIVVLGLSRGVLILQATHHWGSFSVNHDRAKTIERVVKINKNLINLAQPIWICVRWIRN